MVVLDELVQGSSSTHDHRYDVFLSFRGLDTRRSFTNHLHTALKYANLTTFLDDEEIPTGEELKPKLENAIKASRASVIVLSENYASSRWCLDELVLILEQHRNFNQIVIPIFYHVEPTDVRNQQNSFGKAMAEHNQRMETETESDGEKRNQWARKIELWKKALKEVADLKGNDAKGLETEFIEEIVEYIYHRLGEPLRSTRPLLIGMNDSVMFVTSWLKEGFEDTVHILTIFGISGIGKTSLAKYVYGLHYRDFNKSGFIEDISSKCAKNGLLDVQKQLCHDISKKSSIQVHDVSVYTSMIEKARAEKKVFLVLDDIDSLDQLNALLGNKSFHPGSKIIITTKDASLTEKCALFKTTIKPKHKKYELKGLPEEASLELLCHHAFTCKNPELGYEEVSQKLVKYCDGHPLALEVLGCSLYNKDVASWKDYIQDLKTELLPDSRLQKALQMSFHSMPSQKDKELFLHIACFFVGMDRDICETRLRACDIITTTGILNLIDRCLLRIGRNNQLTMHSLIQEMGRYEVDKESPDHPGKRSRLWRHEDLSKVLTKNKGTENIKGLVLDTRKLEKQKLPFKVKTDALNNMDNLMILHLNYVQINGSYENFPEELRWLCMHGFPLKSIPSDLQMENLAVLDMSYSNIESFDLSYSNPEPPVKWQKLKILDLSFCGKLRSLGGFHVLPALESLFLTNCTSLIEVCESIEQCGELVFIDLSYCNEFSKFSKTIAKLKTVKTLLLDGCNLGAFEVRDRDSLKMLKANKTSVFLLLSLPLFIFVFAYYLLCLS